MDADFRDLEHDVSSAMFTDFEQPGADAHMLRSDVGPMAGVLDETMNPSQTLYASKFAFHHGQGGLNMPPPFGMSPDRVPSTQDQILADRASTAVQIMGQVTPPDDTPDRGLQSILAVPSPDAMAMQRATIRSEKARNAANQRHARKQQTREEDTSSGQTESSAQGSQHADKLDKFREKNRLAAAKCRAKKKVTTDGLESEARAAQRVNKELKDQEQHLRDELSYLRNCALEHLASGCQNNQLIMYNQMKADQAAADHAFRAEQMAMRVSSPGMDSLTGSTGSFPENGGDDFAEFMRVNQEMTADQGDFEFR